MERIQRGYDVLHGFEGDREGLAMFIPELLDERDSLAAQVATASNLLDRMVHPSLAPDHRAADHDDALEFLADTEAATTAWLEAHDREQRLAGARELVRRLGRVHFVPAARVLEGMEREASQPG